MAPRRLWRMGPPFSMRHAIGAVLCIAIGYHDPRLATEIWWDYRRAWTRMSDDVRVYVCGRCGQTTSSHELTVR